MNKWMYKIRDEMKKYIERETASWLQGDKDILANMLIEMVKTCLTQRAPDVGVYTCENVDEANRGAWLVCGQCLKPRRR